MANTQVDELETFLSALQPFRLQLNDSGTCVADMYKIILMYPTTKLRVKKERGYKNEIAACIQKLRATLIVSINLNLGRFLDLCFFNGTLLILLQQL